MFRFPEGGEITASVERCKAQRLRLFGHVVLALLDDPVRRVTIVRNRGATVLRAKNRVGRPPMSWAMRANMGGGHRRRRPPLRGVLRSLVGLRGEGGLGRPQGLPAIMRRAGFSFKRGFARWGRIGTAAERWDSTPALAHTQRFSNSTPGTIHMFELSFNGRAFRRDAPSAQDTPDRR